jgi:hypothetical protein
VALVIIFLFSCENGPHRYQFSEVSPNTVVTIQTEEAL